MRPLQMVIFSDVLFVKIIAMKTALAPLALALLLTACGGGGSAPETPPPPPPPVVSVSAPSDQVLAGGAPVALTATVSNGSTVSWQLAAGAPGSLSASSGNSVNYTPPANGVTAATDVAVTASAGGTAKQFTLTVYPDPGQPGLSLLSGSAGHRGFADGKGTAASFTAIQSIAPDNAGGYYVYDGTTARLTVRKISTAGEVSTVYSNSADYNDNAYYYNSRLALASDGMLYVLTWPASGRQLLRISPSGTASVALSGTALDTVLNIQPAGNGAIYLIKPKAVLKMSAAGGIATVAGDPDAPPFDSSPQVDGPGSVARFSSIVAVGADAAGNLLLKDSTTYRRMSVSGTVSTVTLPALGDKPISSISGGPDGGFTVMARQQQGRYVVHKVTPSNETSTLFNDTEPTNPMLASISPLAATGSDGRLILALGAEIRQVNGSKSQSFAGLQDGSGLALDGTAAEARFAQPDMIAADRQGNLYVIDHPGTAYSPYVLGNPGLRGGTLRKISPSGQVTTLAADSSLLGTPTAMLLDRAGNVYLSDEKHWGSKGSTVGSTIVKIAADGTFSTLAGCVWSNDCAAGVADGKGSAARFLSARLLGMDADGNLYARDGRDTPVVRKITPDGTVSTIAAVPAGVGTAPDGGKYELRSGDSGRRIVRIAPAGTETVVAEGLKGRIWIAPAGPYSLGVIVDETVMKLVVPH